MHWAPRATGYFQPKYAEASSNKIKMKNEQWNLKCPLKTTVDFSQTWRKIYPGMSFISPFKFSFPVGGGQSASFSRISQREVRFSRKALLNQREKSSCLVRRLRSPTRVAASSLPRGWGGDQDQRWLTSYFINDDSDTQNHQIWLWQITDHNVAVTLR